MSIDWPMRRAFPLLHWQTFFFNLFLRTWMGCFKMRHNIYIVWAIASIMNHEPEAKGRLTCPYYIDFWNQHTRVTQIYQIWQNPVIGRVILRHLCLTCMKTSFWHVIEVNRPPPIRPYSIDIWNQYPQDHTKLLISTNFPQGMDPARYLRLFCMKKRLWQEIEADSHGICRL